MQAGLQSAVRLNTIGKKYDPAEIEAAVREGRSLFTSQADFVDPQLLDDYLRKWRGAYSAACAKSASVLSLLSGNGTRKQALQFVEFYEQLPDVIQAHNDQVAASRVRAAAALILPVEGRELDEQQLSCIIRDGRNHLVLAGAGTGKTTTIVGYVKYLLKTGICTPNDILVLSFTNASATEMSQRLQNEIGVPIPAFTFHKLGLDIITRVQKKKPRICSADIRSFVRGQLGILLHDSAYLRKLCSYLTFFSTDYKSEFSFQSEKEYQEYLKYNAPITIKGEPVKSYGEMDIANFLAQSGIRYEYEAAYPVDTRTAEYGQYHPDFYLPDYNIYIEYFSVNRSGDVPAYYKARDGLTPAQTYQEGMRWKRELHRQYGTTLIEVYAYEKLEETLLDKLRERLEKACVVFPPVSSEELWNSMGGTDNQKLDRLAELFGTVITLTKSNDCTINDIRGRNRQTGSLNSIYLLLDLVEPIFRAYEDELKEKGEIDFNDMINLASRYVEAGQYRHGYQYVIIDEYQDISQSRFRLLEAMRRQRDYRLFCVGDDWQSIYRFSGSDIGFILNFEKYWGPSVVSKIEHTYRFPQSLIDVSGSFMMKNPEQKQKRLRSAVAGNGFALEKITAYNDRYAVIFLSERLNDLPKGSTVFFLGRYRFDIKMFDENEKFSYHYDAAAGETVVEYRARRDLQIRFITVHSSKGLQADYVFLLNNKARGMGFPSQIADAPVFQLLLDNCDHFPFAEERRLFYVAITRAKKKVWLLTLKGNESLFVNEIDEQYGEAMRKAQYTCPLCGGRLVRRSSQHGDFWGCSNYHSTGCRYSRNTINSKA